VVRIQDVELLGRDVKLIFSRKKRDDALEKSCGIGVQAPIQRLKG
jgi:hypothetical protein